MIAEFLSAIETYDDVIMFLLRRPGIDVNELSRHPQMDHPNHVTAERNQNVLRSSSDLKYGFASQALSQSPVDEAA